MIERIKIFIYTSFKIYFWGTNPKYYAKCGRNVDLFGPLNLDPSRVVMEDYTRLQPGIRMISAGGKLIVRKFSAIGADTLIVPGSHIPTVGLPQYLSMAHVNDTETTIVVEEDCWIGARSILLSHCHIGRGSIVAAGSIVTKEILPYSVVAGCPAKLVAVRFGIDQILEHEHILYPESERYTRAELERIFNEHFQGKKTLGVNNIPQETREELFIKLKEKGIATYE